MSVCIKRIILPLGRYLFLFNEASYKTRKSFLTIFKECTSTLPIEIVLGENNPLPKKNFFFFFKLKRRGSKSWRAKTLVIVIKHDNIHNRNTYDTKLVIEQIFICRKKREKKITKL